MKILYSGYLKDLSKSTGVVAKMLSIEKAAKKIGVNFNIHLYTSSEIPHVLSGKTTYIDRKKYKLFWHEYFIENLHKYSIDNNIDCLLLRHSGFSPFFKNTFKNKKYKLITEHHTLEIPEYISTRKYFFLISELFSQQSSFKSIDGLIAVTPEIANYEILRSKFSKDKIKIITNGVDTNAIPFTPALKFDGSVLNLLFLGSYRTPWHGLDRILLGLKDYNKIKIKLHIVGNIEYKSIKRYLNNSNKIELYGTLNGKKLDEVFYNTNIAISTMALFRKKMTQACPLKSREYIARGIPFIYSYEDPDLSENLPFTRKFPQDESPINIDEVIEFAEDISSNDFNKATEYMRNFAQNNLDWKIKIQEYLRFINKISN